MFVANTKCSLIIILIVTLLPDMHLFPHQELQHKSCEEWYHPKQHKHWCIVCRLWFAQSPPAEWCCQDLPPEKQLLNTLYFQQTSKSVSLIFLVRLPKQKATNIFVDKHTGQRNCCEEYSRLHSEYLMVEFFWVWDFICYTITDLDRSWGLQEAEAPRIPSQLFDDVGIIVSPAQTSILFPENNPGFISVSCWVDCRATLGTEVQVNVNFKSRHR